jgi:hypothetical protein
VFGVRESGFGVEDSGVRVRGPRFWGQDSTPRLLSLAGGHACGHAADHAGGHEDDHAGGQEPGEALANAGPAAGVTR